MIPTEPRVAKAQSSKPDYSLVGPSAYKEQDDENYNSDEGFGHCGRRPQATIGLGKPSPRRKKGDRWRKRDSEKNTKQAVKGSRAEERSESGKREGQVGASSAFGPV